MTGTIALSAAQLAAITERSNRGDGDLVRVVIHPAADHAVRVETHSIVENVVSGHFYALRSGETLTGKEFDEYEGRRVLGS